MFLKRNIAPLLFTTATLLLASSAFGQTKKGFKALEKEKWEAAALAFVADTTNKELRPIALFGLASTLANAANPQHDYVEAMRLQKVALQEWKKLRTAQRTALTSEYKVTSGTIDKLKSTSVTSAWKEIEKKPTLRQTDDFLDAFEGSRSSNMAKAIKKQEALLETAINSAKTYTDYAYLSRRHRKDIPLRYPTALAAIDQSAFDLFMQEKGVDWLGQFYAENPQHPLIGDNGRNSFPEAWISTELAPVLDFLAAYPSSGFAPYIRRKAVDLLKKQPLDDQLRQELTGKQRSTVGEIELEAEGKMINTEKPFDPKDEAMWLNYVQKLAPSERAYDALEIMTKTYLLERNWAAASKALHTAQPLFSERKEWFDQLIPLVDAPATGVKPVNIGAVVNTSGGSEYIPIPSVDGKTLYFCATDRPDSEQGEDVFVTIWQDSAWSKPKLVTELSGRGNQAPISLTEGDSRMILFNNGKPQQTDKTPTGWTVPIPVNADMSRFSWVGLVQIAANGQLMLFEASENTRGNIDIYMCQRDESGSWKSSVRVDALCTKGEDRSPYLHPDMKTIYFSTDDKAGMGQLDVYRATALDDTWLNWSTPVNLGKEINTPGDDWGYKISTDGQFAWFSTGTNRRSQDIFYVELPPEMRPEVVKQVEFYLIDDQKKPLTNATVVLEAQKTGKRKGTYRPDPVTGKVVMPVPNDEVYTIHIEKEGYISKSEVLPVQKPGQPLTIKPDLRPVAIKDGQTLALYLLFDYDQAVLHDESLPELRRVAEQAKKGKFRLNVFGYTDNAGSPAYNLDLSKRRAQAATQALINLGIPADQITTNGFGEQQAIERNDTEEHRSRNRRVEVQFVK